MIRTKITREKCLIPELHQLGWAVFDKAVRDEENLPEHIHTQTYEICYIAHGSVDLCVENEAFQVPAGNIFLTAPGEKHGGMHDVMNPCKLYWLQLEMPQQQDFVVIADEDAALLVEAFSDIKHRVFPASDDVENLFQKIIAEHEKPTTFSKTIVKAVLIELSIEVVRSFQAYVNIQHGNEGFSPKISQAVRIIESGFASELKFDDIAKLVGLSSTTFYKLFAEQIHMSPGEFLTRQRMCKAKELLMDSNISITDIGHRLGYSSSQYFSTIFKKYAGITPKQFRDASEK